MNELLPQIQQLNVDSALLQETRRKPQVASEKRPRGKVAYIVKGFPRRSESFISNEVRLLERMRLALCVFSAFRPAAQTHRTELHTMTTPVIYLPEHEEAIDSNFYTWVRKNLPRYGLSHLRLLMRAPRAYFRTFVDAAWLSFHCRKRRTPQPNRAIYRDFLRAGFIADRIQTLGDVDHLHAHFCHGATTMAMFTSGLTGTPFSFTAHAKDIYLPELNPRDLLQIKMRRAQFVVTCTNANRFHLEGLCSNCASVSTIYHGVNIEQFSPMPVVESDVPLILSVGRFVEKKGFPFLIEACRLLKQRGQSFRCRIVGDPAEQSERVHQLVYEYDLSNEISIEKGMTQDQLCSIYAEATVFTLPCHVVDSGDRDGIPNVIAESMAMGVPVVSTRVSGIPELITDKEDGVLVEQRNPKALADALEQLLVDPKLRNRLGEAARETICRIFDSKTTTVALYQRFLSCLKSAKHKV